jgi:hypothetical protein
MTRPLVQILAYLALDAFLAYSLIDALRKQRLIMPLGRELTRKGRPIWYWAIIVLFVGGIADFTLVAIVLIRRSLIAP